MLINSIPSEMKKEYLRKYQIRIENYDFIYHSSNAKALIIREKIKKIEKELSEDDKKNLYQIDKKAIKFFNKSKNYKNMSLYFLKKIVKMAKKFIKKYVKKNITKKDLKEWLKIYSKNFDLLSLEYDNEVSLVSIYRRLIEENVALLTDKQKNFLYKIDKKYINLYKKVRTYKNNISVLYLKIIAKRALEFCKFWK